MPLIWMEAGPPPMWLMAHWPATPRTIVNQTTGGAANGTSRPSCVFIIHAAGRKTAVEMATVWREAVGVRKAGRAPPVTPWCVSRLPALPTVSALLEAVSVMLDGEGRIVAKSASQVVTVTAVIRPAPVPTVGPATLFTDTAAALLVSTVSCVKKCVLWVSLVCPALRSANVTTCVHVTHRREAVTPHCQERPTPPYRELVIAWPNKCLHLGEERKKLTERSLIWQSVRGSWSPSPWLVCCQPAWQSTWCRHVVDRWRPSSPCARITPTSRWATSTEPPHAPGSRPGTLGTRVLYWTTPTPRMKSGPRRTQAGWSRHEDFKDGEEGQWYGTKWLNWKLTHLHSPCFLNCDDFLLCWMRTAHQLRA